MVAENYLVVKKRVEDACRRAGRNTDEVLLIAVSKTKPVSMIEDAMKAGAVDFGENKPQELRDKYEVLPKDLNWHMIGHLQKNKIKYVISRACLIHSVDTVELAEAINREAGKTDRIVPVLMEINIGNEESKFGITVEDAEENLRKMAELPNLTIKGLMAIAPFVEEPEENRGYFKQMKRLLDDLNAKEILPEPMTELSMGMTGDYEVAIEEGSTMVRVGTGIFGDRVYL